MTLPAPIRPLIAGSTVRNVYFGGGVQNLGLLGIFSMSIICSGLH
jgi:hypothetical protein